MLWDGTYGFLSSSKKTRRSNRLQMSLERQHFLLSYLKTLGDPKCWSGRDLSPQPSSQQTGSLPKVGTSYMIPIVYRDIDSYSEPTNEIHSN